LEEKDQKNAKEETTSNYDSKNGAIQAMAGNYEP
jgi:hypothetical protein